jgi:hypothetical protein
MFWLIRVAKMGRRLVPIITIVAAVSATPSCGARADESNSPFLLVQEPKGAVDVLTARKETKDQQDVVIVGRIGGRPNPWIKGMAAFPLVDRSLTPCNELEGDHCKTPWDYCCEPDVAKATVLVMFVDDAGKVVKKDPQILLGVKALSTVVVQGIAKRDTAGNMTILASKVHIKKDAEATP